MKRSLGVFWVLLSMAALAGAGCGQAGDVPQDASLMPASAPDQSSAAAHIVCNAEDPCPAGKVCYRGIRCVPACKTNADCTGGTTCQPFGKAKICLP